MLYGMAVGGDATMRAAWGSLKLGRAGSRKYQTAWMKRKRKDKAFREKEILAQRLRRKMGIFKPQCFACQATKNLQRITRMVGGRERQVLYCGRC